jgi:V/A-type H+-transporting ATPase subunit C
LKELRFTYAVAYMRSLENKMLDASDLDALLATNDLADALRYLDERGYAGADTAEGKSGIDQMLRKELEFAWEEVRGVCPQEAPIDVFLYPHDFHNLKTVLKAVFSDAGWRELMLYPVTVDPELIYRAVAENNLELLPPMMFESAAAAYQLLARTRDGRRAEILIDHAVFQAMRKEAETAENAFLLGWVDLWASLSNMKAALRMAEDYTHEEEISALLLPEKTFGVDALAAAVMHGTASVLTFFADRGYGAAARAAEQSVSEFEKWSDDTLMEYMKQVIYSSFGFEPLAAFLYGKKTEIQAVRIVLYGLLNHVREDVIKGRLRELYV